jgi:hypothetical protein
VRAVQELTIARVDELGVIGASCTLDAADIPARIAEWAALRERAVAVRRIPGGMTLALGADESLPEVMHLVARESACCAFYTFTLRVEGTSRELHINAGEGRDAAVEALLGL